MSRPKISVVTPCHNMENGAYFLKRLEASLDMQNFRDFEHIKTWDGKMAENTNSGIKKAKGTIIKILFMDDYLCDADALTRIAYGFEGGWMASGCVHDNGVEIGSPHVPTYVPGSHVNTIGSPSVVAFQNHKPLLFDEKLSWMLDVDLYHRLYERFGYPTIIPHMDVCIGLHRGQTTHLMGEQEKQEEVDYVVHKHGK